MRYLKRRTYEEVMLSIETKSKTDLVTLNLVNATDFVNHMDYLVHKTGIDYLGISSNFEGRGGIEC